MARLSANTAGLVFAAALVLATSPILTAENLINLEWRPATATVNVGDPVNIGLYAVCAPGQTQLFRAADVVFAWNPAQLQLLGIDNTGAVPLLSSVLPANDPYNLNGPTLPPSDGDGYYRAWANLGAPLTITDAGSLLTTFLFTATAPTANTVVSIPVSGGNPVLYTLVLGSPQPGTIVTGTLGTATVVVPGLPCPGDGNCDGHVGFEDIDYFVAAIPDNETAWAALYAARHGGNAPPCSFLNNDCSGDGHVSFDDIDLFVTLIPSNCP